MTCFPQQALAPASIRVYTFRMDSKRWQVQPPITPQAEASLEAYPPLLRQILFNRGYASDAEARAFLKAQPDFKTDPYGLTGVATAVERIQDALEQHEPIAVYGDYDVDGVTATALLTQTLSALGADVRGYIPNRFDEGYGLNNEALSALKDDGVRLVITVDCGIRSPDEAVHASAIGLDLIISDHHHPAVELPQALAIINPKQPGDSYPYKDLAGVGLAYKLAEGLLERIPTQNLHLSDLLDLVALGTVADLAPLTGENRALVRQGLRQMQHTARQGLASLAAVAELNLQKITTSNIGFGLGPRLNAAGRLDEALAAYELLTTSDVAIAGQLAQQLDVQNRERQRITREMQAQAEALALADDPEAYLLFAAHEDFNPGVVGLAASRLTETYYRPAIVAHRDVETTRGSCRSIPEFHITQALDQCADLLIRHGGHAAAAGFTVRNQDLPELIQRLKAIAAEQLSGVDLRPTLTADTEVPLSEMRPEVHQHLSYLEPTGYGNPEAVFVSRDVRVKKARTVGAESRHLKLTVEDERGVVHDAIGFRLGHMGEDLPPRVDLMYRFEINEFNGRTSFQLNLLDLKPSGTPD
jgi:single-stranded-DNA-specific exonuclease